MEPGHSKLIYVDILCTGKSEGYAQFFGHLKPFNLLPFFKLLLRARLRYGLFDKSLIDSRNSRKGWLVGYENCSNKVVIV